VIANIESITPDGLHKFPEVLINLSDFHMNGTTQFKKNIFERLETFEQIEIHWLAFDFFTKLILPHINRRISLVVRDPHLVESSNLRIVLSHRMVESILMPSLDYSHPKTKIIGDPRVLDEIMRNKFHIGANYDKTRDIFFPIVEHRLVKIIKDFNYPDTGLYDYYNKQARSLFSVIPANLNSHELLKYATESSVFKTKLVIPQGEVSAENKLQYELLNVKPIKHSFDLLEYLNFS